MDGQQLTVSYTGWLYDSNAPDNKGSIFDSGAGFQFRLGAGQVIAGWDRGLVGMRVGGMRRLVIPPDLAYGSQGQGSIPPNATLNLRGDAERGAVVADFTIKALSPDTPFEELRYWDVVIIGAGPAGLAASLTTAHRGLTTLMIEAKDQPGGQPQFLYADKRIVDVPGFPDGVTGEELSSRVYRQAVDALVQFRFDTELVDIEDTDEVAKDDPLKRVVTSDGSYLCRKVILAMGLLHFPRKLPILETLNSKKVFYKNPRIRDYEGYRVAVVGGGESALDAAVMALERQGMVDLIVREDTPVGKADTLARVQE